MPWTNNDGLRIRYGVEEAVDAESGEYGAFDPGSIHLITVELNPTVLDSIGKHVCEATRLPGANGYKTFIKNAEVFTETPFDSAGDAFTLDIGLDNVDGTVFAAAGAAGIDALTQSNMDAVAETVTCDGSSVKVRLANTQPLNITLTVGGAVPTAGKGWLRVWYYLERI